MIAFRIATLQVNTKVPGGEQTDSLSVSTVPVGVEEVPDHLDAEATLHAAAGWSVRRCTPAIVVAAKMRDADATLVVRTIYAVAFDPAADGDPDIELRPVL